jgi:predicted nucleotidyltransferase
MDRLTARIAARDRAARDRADALRARLPAGVRLLRDRGATRVVLFGSLASGAAVHDATDVDLAVWGLSERDMIDLGLELEDELKASVDLVRAESAGPALAARISRDGKELV